MMKRSLVKSGQQVNMNVHIMNVHVLNHHQDVIGIPTDGNLSPGYSLNRPILIQGEK